MGCHDSNTDYPKESDQSSSAVTATLQTRLKDVLKFTESDTEALSAVCPEHPENTCLWVDSYTFRYIEKFDIRRCSTGAWKVLMRPLSVLMELTSCGYC